MKLILLAITSWGWFAVGAALLLISMLFFVQQGKAYGKQSFLLRNRILFGFLFLIAAVIVAYFKVWLLMSH